MGSNEDIRVTITLESINCIWNEKRLGVSRYTTQKDCCKTPIQYNVLSLNFLFTSWY